MNTDHKHFLRFYVCVECGERIAELPSAPAHSVDLDLCSMECYARRYPQVVTEVERALRVMED